MKVGSGNFVYEYAEDWPRVPDGIQLGWVVAVAGDASDNVYVYNRGEVPMVIFDRDGNYVDDWRQGILDNQAAHGLYFDPDGNPWCTEYEIHCIRKMTPGGDLLLTIGTPGKPGAEGEPFQRPTDVAFDSHGFLYVSDGYDNARVHKYTGEGEFIKSWGEPGTRPGQLNLSHCVRVDPNDRVMVCDRSNDRIQIFDTEGNYLEEWGDLSEPDTIHIDEHGITKRVAPLLSLTDLSI